MDIESRINTALGKILRNYNLLELNIGLCLRSLENPDNPNKSHGYLKRAGMTGAIPRLMKLLERYEHISDTSDFEKWTATADKVRSVRNYYVHATWEYLPLCEAAPLGFRIPPWRNEKISGSPEGSMKIEDLEEQAKIVEDVFYDFMELRRKYRV